MTRQRRRLVFGVALGGMGFALAAALAFPAAAQSFSLDLGSGTSTTGRIVQLVVLLTVLSIAPSILVMVTSFTRIVVVLSFLRSALGVQQTPPNAVLISLALFLTAFVMAPTLEQSYRDGLLPLLQNEIPEEEAFKRSIKPVQSFMMRHVRDQDLRLFLDISNAPDSATADETPLRALVPARVRSSSVRPARS